MDGFAIYKSMNGYAKVDIFVYLNSKAANNILRYLGNRNNSITFTVSENERFEKLFPLDTPRNQGAILAKLNNYKLFSKWIGKEVRTVQQAYDLLDKPCWNHFID